MSLGTGIYSTRGGYSTFGTPFGFSNTDLFKPTLTVLTDAKTVAVAKKDKNWANVLDAIIKYGTPILTLLTTTGVLKNKNIATVQNADYDPNALDALLAANGGTIDKPPGTITVPQSSGFAIDFSNPILLAAIVAVVYLVVKK